MARAFSRLWPALAVALAGLLVRGYLTTMAHGAADVKPLAGLVSSFSVVYVAAYLALAAATRRVALAALLALPVALVGAWALVRAGALG
jgi:hypothetical protein